MAKPDHSLDPLILASARREFRHPVNQGGILRITIQTI